MRSTVTRVRRKHKHCTSIRCWLRESLGKVLAESEDPRFSFVVHIPRCASRHVHLNYCIVLYCTNDIVSCAVYSTQYGFLSRVACFGSCSCSQKKMKFLTKGGIHCISQVFPWHFYFMRGHSLVELTEHDDSAADIILHSMQSYTYMHCCIHST